MGGLEREFLLDLHSSQLLFTECPGVCASADSNAVADFSRPDAFAKGLATSVAVKQSRSRNNDQHACSPERVAGCLDCVTRLHATARDKQGQFIRYVVTGCCRSHVILAAFWRAISGAMILGGFAGSTSAGAAGEGSLGAPHSPAASARIVSAAIGGASCKVSFSRAAADETLECGPAFGEGTASAGDRGAARLSNQAMSNETNVPIAPRSEGGSSGDAIGGAMGDATGGGAVIHTLRGNKKGGQFGHKVAGLGDINGDGHSDFAVTALADDGKHPGSGRCYG